MMLAVLYDDTTTWTPEPPVPGSLSGTMCHELQLATSWVDTRHCGLLAIIGWIPASRLGQLTTASFRVRGLEPLLFCHKPCNQPLLPVQDYETEDILWLWEQSKSLPALLATSQDTAMPDMPPRPTTLDRRLAKTRAVAAAIQNITDVALGVGLVQALLRRWSSCKASCASSTLG
jgi:hypothetical protein